MNVLYSIKIVLFPVQVETKLVWVHLKKGHCSIWRKTRSITINVDPHVLHFGPAAYVRLTPLNWRGGDCVPGTHWRGGRLV